MPRGWFDKKALLILFPIAFLLLACVSYVGFVQPFFSSAQPSAVQDELRGWRTLILRLPTTTVPPQQIEVESNGYAFRVHSVHNPQNRATSLQLATDEWLEIERLRQAWCRVPPTFPVLHP